MLFFGLLGAERTNGQADSLIYYFDSYFNICAREDAAVIGVVRKQGDNWRLDCKSKATGNTLVSGFYRDSLLMVSEGQFQYFSETGMLVKRCSFKEGKKTGIWVDWDETGIKKDSAYYENDNWKAMYVYWSNGVLRREEHWTGGSLEQKEYYPDGKLNAWQAYDDKGKIKFRGLYDENGVLMSEKAQEKEREKKLASSGAHGPEYPGGQGAFQGWVDRLRIPQHIAEEFNLGENLIVTFYLDELGRSYNVSTSRSGEATEFFKQQLDRAPRWKMNGVKKWGPVTFTIHMN